MAFDTTQICRICHGNKNTQDMQLLLEEKLKTKVEIICAIEIKDDDERKYLCNECEGVIESSFRLRQLAQNAAKDSDTSPKPQPNTEEKESDIKVEVSEEERYEYVVDELETSNIEDSVDEMECDEVKSKGGLDSESTCRLCRRIVKQVYLEDHENKCNGSVTKYKCPVETCNKRFVQQKSLNIHTKSQHFNERTFQCDFCGKSYATKEGLKGHMVSHRSERNETCFVCGAKFKSKLSLFKHKVTHENNFFYCSICNARFKNKYDCNYHERIKHLGQEVKRKNPNQKFSCEECTKVYRTKDSLNRHIIRIHKKIKDFICWVKGCNARYGYHSSLKKHLTRKHPEINLSGLTISPDPVAALAQMKGKDIVLVKSGV